MPALALPGELRAVIEGDPDVALMAAVYLRGQMMAGADPAEPTRLAAERILRASGQGEEISRYLEQAYSDALFAAGDRRPWRVRLNHRNAAKAHVRHLGLRRQVMARLAGRSYTGPELARALGEPYETMRTVMLYLLDAGEVHRERDGSAWRYALAGPPPPGHCPECGRVRLVPDVSDETRALLRAAGRLSQNGDRSLYPAPDRGGYP